MVLPVPVSGSSPSVRWRIRLSGLAQGSLKDHLFPMSLDIERWLTGEIPGPGSGVAGRFALPGGRLAEVSVVPVAGTGEAGATRVVTFHDITEAASMPPYLKAVTTGAYVAPLLATALSRLAGVQIAPWLLLLYFGGLLALPPKPREGSGSR